MAKKKPRKRKPPPKCKAILLCDQLIVDAQTGKVSIIGIMDDFHMSSIPGKTTPCHAYLQLTDGIGTYALSVEFHDLQEDVVLARATIPEMAFEDRSAKGNLLIPVPPLPIPHEGVYDFVVLADGQEIDRQQFMAHSIRRDENATDQGEGP